MSKKQGVFLKSLLNGYSKSKRDDEPTPKDIAIDPTLLEDVEEIPSSPIQELNEPMLSSSPSKEQSESELKRKKVNLRNVLSGYSKKSKPNSNTTRDKLKDIILLDASPKKEIESEQTPDIKIVHERLQSAKSSNIASFLKMDRLPSTQRRIKYAKDVVIPTPLPKLQHIPHYEMSNYRSLDLAKRSPSSVNLNFASSEYAALNGKRTFSKLSESISYLEETTNSQLWTSLFKPTSLEDVLIEDDTKTKIRDWFRSAFESLKKKTDRSILYNRKPEDEFDDFIVNDSSFGSELDIETTEFVPLLILYGAVGKNTLLDVIMTEFDGQIFEINCSMNRAKKDISEILNDFATTKYVKDTQSRGIILFDDVDVLLTESDKFFWNSVHSTLVISRRPVVITCRDYRFIPSNLLEVAELQNSIFNIKPASKKKVTQYITNCLDQKGIDIEKNVLQHILDRNCYDIRRSLLNLQWLCTKPGVIRIPDKAKTQAIDTIEDALTKLNFDSSCDIIETAITGKSSIIDDLDLSLNYAKHQFEEQSEGNRDVLWDYAEYLWDQNHNDLFPWEINITSFSSRYDSTMKDSEHFNSIESDALKDTEQCIIEMMRFLRTRVVNNKTDFRNNRTAPVRSSRKRNGAIRDYRLKSEENVEGEEALQNEELLFAYVSNHLFKDTTIYILPFVYKIAKNESSIKAKNLSMFDKLRSHYGNEVSVNDIINEMIQKRLLLPAFFKGSSEPFINSYQ